MFVTLLQISVYIAACMYISLSIIGMIQLKKRDFHHFTVWISSSKELWNQIKQQESIVSAAAITWTIASQTLLILAFVFAVCVMFFKGELNVWMFGVYLGILLVSGFCSKVADSK
ncbi:hypothetical protein MFLO_13800 [Listeria floridensis FSL S10-1187]|uniref:DUF2178 domain-containing protein n=2 Tax=Listeria floridensis TaxID=1494962 RepID=A0ABP3AWZ5_9LIST|nr:hypothetical protein MFLO_13800 [Listeria floridensis FSL S10-1187]